MDQTQAPISESEEIEESLCRTGGGRKVFRVGEWVGGCVVISHSLSLSRCFPPLVLETFQERKKGATMADIAAPHQFGNILLGGRGGTVRCCCCCSLIAGLFFFFYPQLFLTDRIGSLGFSTSGRRSSELELWWCLNVILRP